ncbi:MAG: hypothetical protein KZQ59_00995 [Candidatus Thiodiazotropha sp. (ex Lucinoma aequizonata)]|nr:hypothetical protein [Candidatus Thiodiazotropha sp. (ex Lucinoma aequizonata)]
MRNYSAALYLRLLNSHLIGFLALAKERVRLLPFCWHPGTQLLGAHLNSYPPFSIPLTFIWRQAFDFCFFE